LWQQQLQLQPLQVLMLADVSTRLICVTVKVVLLLEGLVKPFMLLLEMSMVGGSCSWPAAGACALVVLG
jgi:hypothetical protein